MCKQNEGPLDERAIGQIFRAVIHNLAALKVVPSTSQAPMPGSKFKREEVRSGRVSRCTGGVQ